MKPASPQAVVIFGASGDLTRRKLLPALYHLFVEGLLPQGFAVVGYARTPMTDAEFRERAREAVRAFGQVDPDPERWRDFAARLSYVPGEFESERAMEHLRDHLERTEGRWGTGGARFFYCATPPAAYPLIAARLAESDLHRGARIVIEKPFGRDLESARELNRLLHEAFDESQIFRIDHFLGKETVQNILAFRFSNGMFEPIWNRRYVDHVQVTVAEDLRLEGRGAFYEQTGALRDMVQTHLFQLLTFVAMEPPVSFQPDRLRDEKVRVLRSMVLCQPSDVVRGQYRGYREEPGVAPGSTTETFVAARFEVDNWRWADVPFFLRTGKALSRKVTEISLAFRRVPYNVFRGTGVSPEGTDRLVFWVHPTQGISVELNVKKPGLELDLERASLDLDLGAERHLVQDYEVLLLEAMEGDHTLFLREDEVERAWEVLAPVLEDPPPLHVYEPGTWGPEAADELVLPHHWHLSPPPEEAGGA
ncbi:MAG TPA: glucose-6-phosphate dehydrogenase [Actinomycetota bacterium]|nr:glucose-6-phosphate dehydrogenase [Actinomycetota bacterium]